MTRMTSTGAPKVGLVQFPGSNCDMDCIDAMKRHFGITVTPVWHTETSLPPVDGMIIPGGFSFGDYLRSGALASHSPVMQAIKGFVQKGGAAIGICNGFQILTESHLLPGALLRNSARRFVCKQVHLKAADGNSGYHKALAGSILQVPIAHGEGRYFAAPETIKKLRDNGQVMFRYVDESGVAGASANPNGSSDDIAGIVSENGRVLGMMPHPERAADLLTGGSADGRKILQAFLSSFA
jgi:phosphoribosylformylglycinamidine synthase